MKKIIFILTFILSLTTCAFAATAEVQINGEIINFKDEHGEVKAQILNDRTMVPFRKIFEKLGADVDWDEVNDIAIGTKENIRIELQKDNPIAKKIVDGKEELVELSASPTIIDGRTLVPLRFIAESLGKQVGWDTTNRTAIIIDYDYFYNDLKTAAPALYNFLKTNSNNIECSITNNYYDLDNMNNNTNFKLMTTANISNNTQNVSLKIYGNNELSKEIIDEGWNEIAFSLIYNDKNVLLKSENIKLKEMLGIGNEGISKAYEEMNLNNNISNSMIQNWVGIKESDLNIYSFGKIKNDYMMLRNLFSTTNYAGNTKSNSVSSSINYNTYKLEYFDFAKLDNFISSNNHQRLISMINKIYFKNDVLKDVILYDWNNININLSVDNNIFKANIIMENEYNEKNEYIIELKNI